VQGLFGGGVGGISLHAQADVVEGFAIESHLCLDEGILERVEIGFEALAFDIFLLCWVGLWASGRIEEVGEGAVDLGCIIFQPCWDTSM